MQVEVQVKVQVKVQVGTCSMAPTTRSLRWAKMPAAACRRLLALCSPSSVSVLAASATCVLSAPRLNRMQTCVTRRHNA